MNLTANDLKPGDVFRWKARGRKWHTVKETILLGNRSGIPVEHRGKLLIVLVGCKQLLASPDSPVIVPQTLKRNESL